MASIIARRALLSSRTFSTSARRLAESGEPVLKTEGKRNPEIMILGGVMVLALGGAGLYLGRSPTSTTSEEDTVRKSGMPWETGAAEGKYRYYPGGNENAEPKDAPSAVNVVVIPNVTLPKHLHDKYNKWGKDGY
ncbi:hypothetical protein GGR50DRAFT_607129 [Xylaria sp. CBS 124048]|nr:hypothetical protein GGR50DRAFT_607129 [Xylaria sp. CBS 124048]